MRTRYCQVGKKKRSLLFPWWFKIIGYLLSILISAVSIFFILVKGIQFGDAKVNEWLTSLILTFITSILLTQPVQVVLAAIFFMLVFKSSNKELNEIDVDPDDDGHPINNNFPVNLLYNVIHFFNFLLIFCKILILIILILHYKTTSYITPPSSLFNYKKQLSDMLNHNINIEIAKCNRLKELKTKKFFHELFLYLIYLSVLLTISFSNNNNRIAFGYQKNLKALFGQASPADSIGFEQINDVQSFWKWSKTSFLNNLNPSDNSFLKDNSSLLLDRALMRQIRIRNCKQIKKIY